MSKVQPCSRCGQSADWAEDWTPQVKPQEEPSVNLEVLWSLSEVSSCLVNSVYSVQNSCNSRIPMGSPRFASNRDGFGWFSHELPTSNRNLWFTSCYSWWLPITTIATHNDCGSHRSRPHHGCDSQRFTATRLSKSPSSRRVLFGLWDGPVNRIFTRLLNSRGLQVQNKWVCSRCGQPPLVTMQLGSIKKFREKKLIISNYSLLSAVIDHRLLVDCFSLFATVSRWFSVDYSPLSFAWPIVVTISVINSIAATNSITVDHMRHLLLGWAFRNFRSICFLPTVANWINSVEVSV